MTTTATTATIAPDERPATVQAPFILDKALDGREISGAEALTLLQLTQEDDLHHLREVADTVRARQMGDSVHYGVGCSLYLTNLCELSPCLYPYPRASGDAGAWMLTIDDLDAQLEIVRYGDIPRLSLSGGGFWPYLQIRGLEAPTVLKTYVRLLAYIQEHAPTLSIGGFSPDEVEFLCIVSDRSERYVLEVLADHGLKRLGGQGTEILVDPVRQAISPRKATVKRWFEIVSAAHHLQLPVEAALETGPLETSQQRIRHLEQLRAFQRTSGRF